MLRAVLFDLDDTLLDWSNFQSEWITLEQKHLRGVVEWLGERGHMLELHDFSEEFRVRLTNAWEDSRSTLVAPNLGTLILDTAAALRVPQQHLLLREMLEAYRWGAIEGTAIFDDVPDVLQTLIRAGIRIGLVTNAFQPMWLRDREIEQHGILQYFPDCRISAADFGFLKPHPGIFQAALAKLGVSAEETVFVGDDLNADIAGAQAVGIHAVLRMSRNFERFNGSTIRPDETIHRTRDLLPILDHWFPGWRDAHMERMRDGG
jgi:HAD superfamily hydrolase (TIGR01549 family)